AGRLSRDHLLVRLAHEAPGSQLVPFRWRAAKAILEADVVEIAAFDGHPLVQALGPVLRQDQHLRHDILLPRHTPRGDAGRRFRCRKRTRHERTGEARRRGSWGVPARTWLLDAGRTEDVYRIGRGPDVEGARHGQRDVASVEARRERGDA